MQAMVLYLLAAVGVFHTQALHATIQLRGERGAAVTLHCLAAQGAGHCPTLLERGLCLSRVSQHHGSYHCPVTPCPAPLLRVLAGI